MRGTLAAIVGGNAIAFLLTMRERFIAADFHLWYFMGIGVSFFFYAIYILVINILFNHGKIKDEKTYGRFTSTGETTIQHLKRIEAPVDEFEYLLIRWYRREISDEVFTGALERLSLTVEDYRLSRSYGRFDAAAVALFEEKGLEHYLKTD